MHNFTQLLTVMGRVEDLRAEDKVFSIRCKNGDLFDAYVGETTTFNVLQNLDGLGTDRVQKLAANDDDITGPRMDIVEKVRQYIQPGWLIAVRGVWQLNGDTSRFDARDIWLLASVREQYLFEETHWWISQVERLADQWLDSLFGDRRDYDVEDFVKLYETNLSIAGLPVDDTIQECAVLSRLIYGFSAAFLLTGEERYRRAAQAGVAFLRGSFRSLSHDGRHCFWAFGRRKHRFGVELIVPSEAPDDRGSIPLYEQIYALAGLTHYYRISLDPNVLEDIKRTITTFNDLYLDDADKHPDNPMFAGEDGWFSHIDYVTLRPGDNLISANDRKKNWNSIGDHVPAYLINLIIMLDPSPQSNNSVLDELLQTARSMLRRSTKLILKHFTDRDPSVPYVNERFNHDWRPDQEYSWQKDRAIIGHNFKIAWNLTRVANYCDTSAHNDAMSGDVSSAQEWRDLSRRCMEMADRLGRSMTLVGADLIRGGCFDAVERMPKNGQPVEFAWLNTKDFWQQEQAILAYLILFGHQSDQEFLEMARRTEAFWNLFFLDRPHLGIHFRVTENGLPMTDPAYNGRGGHADASGYHCFELAYLAHIYNRIYVAPQKDAHHRFENDQTLCLYFHPKRGCDQESINVLPDFVQPNRLTIKAVRIDGMPRRIADPNTFQIPLGPDDYDRTIAVVFLAHGPDRS